MDPFYKQAALAIAAPAWDRTTAVVAGQVPPGIWQFGAWQSGARTLPDLVDDLSVYLSTVLRPFAALPAPAWLVWRSDAECTLGAAYASGEGRDY